MGHRRVAEAAGHRRVAEAAGRRWGVEAAATSRSAPHREAGTANGSVRSAVPAAFQDAGAVALQGRVAGCPQAADLVGRGVAAAASSPARFCLISGAHWVRTRDTPTLTTHDRLRTAVTSARAVAKPNPRGEICAPPQASHRSKRARPRRFAVERAEGGLGRLRILRSCRDAASEGLRVAHLARRAIRARQRGTQLPLMQHQ